MLHVCVFCCEPLHENVSVSSYHGNFRLIPLKVKEGSIGSKGQHECGCCFGKMFVITSSL